MEAIFLESVFLPESWKSWQIRKTLGEGSYGTVYLAEKQIGSDVSLSAIKIIRISPEANEALSLSLELGNSDLLRKYYEDITLTYIQEIKTMIALKGHPNIVYIEDYAVEADPENTTWTIFIRMEYLTPFSEYVQTHSLSESDVIRLGKDLCSALSACEKNGILHRDIKPSNIFISPATGLFKLGDFGVARKMDRTSGVYSSKGTFPYMAPEVFSGRPYDHRSDLYSLGLVLYLLLNKNREPFVDLNKQMTPSKQRWNPYNPTGNKKAGTGKQSWGFHSSHCWPCCSFCFFRTVLEKDPKQPQQKYRKLKPIPICRRIRLRQYPSKPTPLFQQKRPISPQRPNPQQQHLFPA